MRIFFDTSVLVSALTFPGVCADLLTLAFEQHTVCVNEYVLQELQRILETKFKIGADISEQRIAELRVFAEVAATSSPLPTLPLREPADVPVLQGALSCGAAILVSGDKDLLELKGIPITIVGPRLLLNHLRSSIQ